MGKNFSIVLKAFNVLLFCDFYISQVLIGMILMVTSSVRARFTKCCFLFLGQKSPFISSNSRVVEPLPVLIYS